MNVAVKDKPILFSGPMVRAILDGRKTMTRRVVKPQPVSIGEQVWQYGDEVFVSDDSMQDHLFHNVYGGNKMPYGGCYEGYGDRLWVRETWRETFDVSDRLVMEYRAGGTRLITGSKEHPAISHGEHQETSILPKWRPSIFMPRWASRITLEITEVRVERLQEISAKDIIAEGVVERSHDDKFLGKSPVSAFDGCVYPDLKSLWACGWDEINKKRGYGWDTNPWVWVVSFRRIKGA